MLLYLLRETHQHGDPGDESNYSTTVESFLAFPNEDTAEECLTGYYENQDCDYQVSATRLLEVRDSDLHELAGVIVEYTKAL
jgi:hypothetical protein